jgi:hypothetical protein
MKNYKNYILGLFSLVVFFGCNDPLGDELKIAEEALSKPAKVIEYTLADADYEIVDIRFGNFNSEDHAKENVPTILSSIFPALGDGSSAAITYNIYAPKRSQRVQFLYEVTSDDYDAQGHSFGNYDSFQDITEFLDWKYPSLESYEDTPRTFESPSNGDFVFLTYKYYNGSVNEFTDGFIYNSGAWEKAGGFTQAEYNAMGENFANFSNDDEAMVKIPIFLKDKFKFDPQATGTVLGFSYGLYSSGDVYGTVVYFTFNGSEWVQYNNEIQQVLRLGKKGGTWIPDNTIKITLSSSDYATIGAIEGGDRGANVADFNSFYQGSNTTGGTWWANEDIEEVLLEFVNQEFAGEADGQKYALTYEVYIGSGAYQTRTAKFIKVEGAYIVNDEEE